MVDKVTDKMIDRIIPHVSHMRKKPSRFYKIYEKAYIIAKSAIKGKGWQNDKTNNK